MHIQNLSDHTIKKYCLSHMKQSRHLILNLCIVKLYRKESHHCPYKGRFCLKLKNETRTFKKVTKATEPELAQVNSLLRIKFDE